MQKKLLLDIIGILAISDIGCQEEFRKDQVKALECITKGIDIPNDLFEKVSATVQKFYIDFAV